ncbi:hypothetical protein ACFL1E_07925, partial [Candidatus Omnitrophota bacterium]
GIDDAASRMGEQYSVSNSSKHRYRTALADQEIVEETASSAEATDTVLNEVFHSVADDSGSVAAGAYDVKGVVDMGAHNMTTRIGNKYAVVDETATDKATSELMRVADYEKLGKDYIDYGDPFTAPE